MIARFAGKDILAVMETSKVNRIDKDYAKMIRFFSNFEFLKYQEPAYYEQLSNVAMLKVYKEMPQESSLGDHLGAASLMDGDQSVRSGSDIHVRELSRSAFGKFSMNGGDRAVSPNAYTEGAGSVFHPRKPGS
jgi:hypothetical protein